MNQFALGVDIGGTHITAAVIDLDTRTILPETITRHHVNSGSSVRQVIIEWSSAIANAAQKYKSSLQQIGLAMPGPFDYEKGVALMQNQGKYDALYNLNVKNLLAEALGVETICLKFQNDAPCFLLGEVFAGSAKGYHKVIGLTLGTGLGSTVYANGEATDANLWKIPFHESIAEEYLSSRWFVKRYRQISGKEVVNVKALAELQTTEPLVLDIFNEFGANLALFLKHFVQLENPEAIILGGNIAKAYPLFENCLTQFLLSNDIFIPVKLAALGEEAALLGAASLWRKFQFQ